MPALFSIIIIGILQGLTEFLPVSSSGHLSLFQYFSETLEDNLSLNIAVHLGTLLTIVIYYRSDLISLLRGSIARESKSLKMVGLILVASVPTAILGLTMKKLFEWLLTDPLVAALCLLITGIVLFASRWIKVTTQVGRGFGIGYRHAFLIGTIQGLAVLPGISRSGSTIIGGLYLGMTPSNAARFSFFISLPAIAGAGLLEFLGSEGSVNIEQFLIGGFVSFVTGLFAISWMVKITQRANFAPFAYYVVTLGVVFLFVYSWGLGAGSF